MRILARNGLITILLSLALLISINLSTHFSTKKTSTPKRGAYPIMEDLYSAAFLLIILANSPPKSSVLQANYDRRSDICPIFPSLSLSAPTFTQQPLKFTWLLSW